jgi:hypothetical protein
MNTNDAIQDHQLAIVFEGIRCPIERVKFFRANKSALARESARRDAGTPLPAPPSIVNTASAPRMGLTVRRNGVIMRHIPSRGLFGK